MRNLAVHILTSLARLCFAGERALTRLAWRLRDASLRLRGGAA